MPPTTDQTVAHFERVSREFRKRVSRDPAYARAHLIKLGIIEKHAKSPSGVRLTKRFRSPA